MNSTKRALALVAGVSAVLAAGTVGSTPAKAQLQNMLLQGIQSPTAGREVGTTSMVKGTIQYTNSAGSNDAFSVGTSTSINSNASASSTSDYAVTADANFAMGDNGGIDGLTTIQQQIGTAGANTSSQMSSADRAASASSSAELTAQTEVNKSFKTSHNGQSGWWWWGNNQWNNTTEQEYNTKRDSVYKSSYDAAYSSSYSALTEASIAQGTISGSFVKDAGKSISTVSDDYSFQDANGDQVTGSVSWDGDGTATFTADTGTEKVTTSSLARTTTFEQERVSSNDVTVNGIGADNNIVASDAANFTTGITKTGNADDSGTASGSAGGSVNTTASASASSSTFINSFVQAY